MQPNKITSEMQQKRPSTQPLVADAKSKPVPKPKRLEDRIDFKFEFLPDGSDDPISHQAAEVITEIEPLLDGENKKIIAGLKSKRGSLDWILELREKLDRAEIADRLASDTRPKTKENPANNSHHDNKSQPKTKPNLTFPTIEDLKGLTAENAPQFLKTRLQHMADLDLDELEFPEVQDAQYLLVQLIVSCYCGPLLSEKDDPWIKFARKEPLKSAILKLYTLADANKYLSKLSKIPEFEHGVSGYSALMECFRKNAHVGNTKKTFLEVYTAAIDGDVLAQADIAEHIFEFERCVPLYLEATHLIQQIANPGNPKAQFYHALLKYGEYYVIEGPKGRLCLLDQDIELAKKMLLELAESNYGRANFILCELTIRDPKHFPGGFSVAIAYLEKGCKKKDSSSIKTLGVLIRFCWGSVTDDKLRVWLKNMKLTEEDKAFMRNKYTLYDAADLHDSIGLRQLFKHPSGTMMSFRQAIPFILESSHYGKPKSDAKTSTPAAAPPSSETKVALPASQPDLRNTAVKSDLALALSHFSSNEPVKAFSHLELAAKSGCKQAEYYLARVILVKCYGRQLFPANDSFIETLGDDPLVKSQLAKYTIKDARFHLKKLKDDATLKAAADETIALLSLFEANSKLETGTFREAHAKALTGDIKATHDLAKYLLNQTACSRVPTIHVAINLLKKIAFNGDGHAAFVLSNLYKTGYKVTGNKGEDILIPEPNPTEAEKYLAQAKSLDYKPTLEAPESKSIQPAPAPKPTPVAEPPKHLVVSLPQTRKETCKEVLNPTPTKINWLELRNAGREQARLKREQQSRQDKAIAQEKRKLDEAEKGIQAAKRAELEKLEKIEKEKAEKKAKEETLKKAKAEARRNAEAEARRNAEAAAQNQRIQAERARAERAQAEATERARLENARLEEAKREEAKREEAILIAKVQASKRAKEQADANLRVLATQQYEQAKHCLEVANEAFNQAVTSASAADLETRAAIDQNTNAFNAKIHASELLQHTQNTRSLEERALTSLKIVQAIYSEMSDERLVGVEKTEVYRLESNIRNIAERIHVIATHLTTLLPTTFNYVKQKEDEEAQLLNNLRIAASLESDYQARKNETAQLIAAAECELKRSSETHNRCSHAFMAEQKRSAALQTQLYRLKQERSENQQAIAILTSNLLLAEREQKDYEEKLENVSFNLCKDVVQISVNEIRKDEAAKRAADENAKSPENLLREESQRHETILLNLHTKDWMEICKIVTKETAALNANPLFTGIAQNYLPRYQLCLAQSLIPQQPQSSYAVAPVPVYPQVNLAEFSQYYTQNGINYQDPATGQWYIAASQQDSFLLAQHQRYVAQMAASQHFGFWQQPQAQPVAQPQVQTQPAMQYQPLSGKPT